MSKLRILPNCTMVLSRGEMIIFVFLKDPHDSSVENKSDGVRVSGNESQSESKAKK